ncbi:hypothetical protein HX049_18120 [Myroides odoratimimus]|uniref:hypothetical protein n=1 Tax=Myroides odoratimimus TaxID=76832 RepID=UPI002577E2B0|nr:hypothetical protein [Myroides odoratimimus]MDM1399046.1 hypothetical protein [Myroides odoratimimus]
MANYKLDNLYTKEEYRSKKGLTHSELKDKLEAGEIEIVSINGGALIKDGDFDLERDYMISEAVNKILSLKKVNVEWLENKINSVIEEVEKQTISDSIDDILIIRSLANKLNYLCDLQDALLMSKYNDQYRVYELKGKTTDYITFLKQEAFNI